MLNRPPLFQRGLKAHIKEEGEAMGILKRVLKSQAARKMGVGTSLFLLWSVPGAGTSWAGSKLINVMGKLTDATGKPLGGSPVVTFRVYTSASAPLDQCNNPPTSIGKCVWVESQGIVMQEGLFNITLGNVASLDPLPFDKPYYLGMQVAGDNNELQPRQLLGASAYALGSLGDFHVRQNLSVNSNASVNGDVSANGNISATTISANTNISAKGTISANGSMVVNGKDVGSYLVPPGAIMLFAGNCPSGWSRFTSLDNRFPMGQPSYGATGGSATHNHSISPDGAHNHGGVTGLPNQIRGDGRAGANDPEPTTKHTHNIGTNAAHNHGGTTGTANTLPPYLGVVFCQKQ